MNQPEIRKTLIIDVPYHNDSPLSIYVTVYSGGALRYSFDVGSPEQYTDDPENTRKVLRTIAQDILDKVKV